MDGIISNRVAEAAERLVHAVKIKDKELFGIHLNIYNIRVEALQREFQYEMAKITKFSNELNKEGKRLGYITEPPKQEPQAEVKAEQPKENPLAIQKTRPEGKQTKKAKK